MAQAAHLSKSGIQREPVDEAFVAPLIERSRDALGAAEFDAVCAAGQALNYEQSMAELKRWVANFATPQR